LTNYVTPFKNLEAEQGKQASGGSNSVAFDVAGVISVNPGTLDGTLARFADVYAIRP